MTSDPHNLMKLLSASEIALMLEHDARWCLPGHEPDVVPRMTAGVAMLLRCEMTEVRRMRQLSRREKVRASWARHAPVHKPSTDPKLRRDARRYQQKRREKLVSVAA